MRFVYLCILNLMFILIVGCSSQEANLSYTTSDNLNLVGGTSQIINLSDTFSEKESAKIQGQLLSLFGNPIYSTKNLENAYSYVVIATDSAGKKYTFNVYSGPTGPAIGGDPSVKNIKDVADKLKNYVSSAIPSDFEYSGYYLDGPSKVTLGVKDGKSFYSEKPLSKSEYETALKECGINASSGN